MIAQVEILHWLTQHGVTLLLGSTCVLGAGCLSMLLHRGPARRRQLGITTATAVVLYLCVAPWPLPRW